MTLISRLRWWLYRSRMMRQLRKQEQLQREYRNQYKYWSG